METRRMWRTMRRVALPVLVALLATGTPIDIGPFGADPAGAVSNTPVWIGAPYPGNYRNGTRPGQHGGNQVAFDYYAVAGTLVEIYAAPKNAAYNSAIKAFVVASGAGSGNAARCGYYAVVEIRHSGNPIGRVTFSHLAAPAAKGERARWGGDIGRIARLPWGYTTGCYQVNGSSGEHTHIEYRNYNTTRPACAHDYGAPAPKVRGNYQGYLGVYSKPPLSGNRCPSGI